MTKSVCLSLQAELYKYDRDGKRERGGGYSRFRGVDWPRFILLAGHATDRGVERPGTGSQPS
jgi:hypothetical protein